MYAKSADPVAWKLQTHAVVEHIKNQDKKPSTVNADIEKNPGPPHSPEGEWFQDNFIVEFSDGCFTRNLCGVAGVSYISTLHATRGQILTAMDVFPEFFHRHPCVFTNQTHVRWVYSDESDALFIGW